MREAISAHFRSLPKTRSGRGQREHCTIFPSRCAKMRQVGQIARVNAPESVPGKAIAPNRHDPGTQGASHYRQNRCVYLCNGAFTFAHYAQNLAIATRTLCRGGIFCRFLLRSFGDYGGHVDFPPSRYAQRRESLARRVSRGIHKNTPPTRLALRRGKRTKEKSR